MSQSPSKWAPWDLTQFSQLPSAALSYFPESHQWSEISSLSKVILVLGKTLGEGDFSFRFQVGAVGGLSHLGDLMFRKKSLHKMHEQARRRDEAANHQLPMAAAF